MGSAGIRDLDARGSRLCVHHILQACKIRRLEKIRRVVALCTPR